MSHVTHTNESYHTFDSHALSYPHTLSHTYSPAFALSLSNRQISRGLRELGRSC